MLASDKDIRDEVSKYQIDRYRQLKKELSKHSEFNDRWEELEDELEKLEKELPSILIEREKKLIKCESKIAILKKEKSILGRVIQTEGGNGETLQKDIKEKPEIKI